jgi:hypothetical protein
MASQGQIEPRPGVRELLAEVDDAEVRIASRR